MKIDNALLAQIECDLGLDRPFVKGQTISIKKCWHFSTDGNAVDQIFYDEDDFVAGMNRIFIVVKEYQVVILAFSLMDTHVHFVLYGALEECNRFMHDYVNRTSRHISMSHGDHNKMDGVPIHYQSVDTDKYLKTVICYTVKNAPVGGIAYMGWVIPGPAARFISERLQHGAPLPGLTKTLGSLWITDIVINGKYSGPDIARAITSE